MEMPESENQFGTARTKANGIGEVDIPKRHAAPRRFEKAFIFLDTTTMLRLRGTSVAYEVESSLSAQ